MAPYVGGRGRRKHPWSVVAFIEMSGVAAFLAVVTTDVVAADTAAVLSAAMAAGAGYC